MHLTQGDRAYPCQQERGGMCCASKEKTHEPKMLTRNV